MHGTFAIFNVSRTLPASPFLASTAEYVPGGSLSSQLSRFGPLPEQLVALYTRQLLLGLAYLHAQRTVHRDVKVGRGRRDGGNQARKG